MEPTPNGWSILFSADGALLASTLVGVFVVLGLAVAAAARVRVPAPVWWLAVLAPVTLGAGDALIAQSAGLAALGGAAPGAVGEQAAAALKAGRSLWAHGLLGGGVLAACAALFGALGFVVGASRSARFTAGHAVVPGAVAVGGGLITVAVGTTLAAQAPQAGMIGVFALVNGLFVAAACTRLGEAVEARERSAAGRGLIGALAVASVTAFAAAFALRDGAMVLPEAAAAVATVLVSGLAAVAPVLVPLLRPRAVVGAAVVALLGALPLAFRLAAVEVEQDLRRYAPDPVADRALVDGLTLAKVEVDGPPPARDCVLRWTAAGPQPLPDARCGQLPLPEGRRPLLLVPATLSLAELHRVRWASEAIDLHLLVEGPNGLGVVPVRWLADPAPEAVPRQVGVLLAGEAQALGWAEAGFQAEGPRGPAAEVFAPLMEQAKRAARPMGVLAGRGATVAELAGACATVAAQPRCVLLPWRAVVGSSPPEPSAWYLELLPRASEASP